MIGGTAQPIVIQTAPIQVAKAKSEIVELTKKKTKKKLFIYNFASILEKITVTLIVS